MPRKCCAMFDNEPCKFMYDSTNEKVTSHDLMIEKGRHSGVNKTERFCPFCTDIVESEEHSLLRCATFSPLRATLISKIVVKIAFPEQMSDHTKFLTLLTNENIVDEVGNYIQKALHCRRFLLSKHKNSM